MSIGHRIFVVEEDAIFPISQKIFNELYSGKVGALSKFAGQTVQIAVAVYTLHQRKPERASLSSVSLKIVLTKR